MKFESKELVPKATLDELELHRAKALEEYATGQAALLRAEAAATRATPGEPAPSLGYRYHHSVSGADFDLETFRRRLDAGIWRHLLRVSQLRTVMSTRALEAFEKSLDDGVEARVDTCQPKATPVPEATTENILATIARLLADAPDMFGALVADLWKGLPQEYRTNQASGFGPRVIFNYAVTWGIWYSSERVGRWLYDLEKAFKVLDGKPAPENVADINVLLTAAVRESNPSPWVAATDYLRVKVYKKGSAHVELLRQDLREKLNRTLAGTAPGSLTDR